MIIATTKRDNALAYLVLCQREWAVGRERMPRKLRGLLVPATDVVEVADWRTHRATLRFPDGLVHTTYGEFGNAGLPMLVRASGKPARPGTLHRSLWDVAWPLPPRLEQMYWNSPRPFGIGLDGLNAGAAWCSTLEAVELWTIRRIRRTGGGTTVSQNKRKR